MITDINVFEFVVGVFSHVVVEGLHQTRQGSFVPSVINVP
jgi:hypothetical protein